jgi:hypothetical protein
VAISTDLLLSVYQSRTAVRAGTAALGSGARKTVPTAPWEATAKAPPVSDLVKSVLAGRKFIQPDSVQLDLPGANPADYKALFGLYQGLNALNALAERANAKGVGTTELAQLERRFAAGMKETDAFLDTLELEQLRLIRGEPMTTAKTATGVKRDRAEYVTGMVHAGRMDEAAPALAGDVRFSVDVRKPSGTIVSVPIDLAEMGSETRSFGNLINHLNAKLQAAGVGTRFDRVKLPTEARSVTVGGKTVALPDGPERWAMKVVGVDTEKVSFGAPAAADAVYLAQTTGIDDLKAKTTSAQQIVKLQTDQTVGAAPPPAFQTSGEPNWVEGQAFARTLGPEIAAVRATATGADGSVYMLADVDAKVDGQAIKGERDVALLKYDAAGKLHYTRTLGAAEEAQGYALAVSADGKVAIAGSVTGALGGADAPLDAEKSDSFVTLFDSEGSELWTRRRGAVAEDEGRAVAFATDGTVLVAGRARSAVAGGTAVGDWDGYLQSFKGADGTMLAASQFGTVGSDGAAALAVDGASVVVAGSENGRAVLRRFDLGAGSALTAGVMRDLGALSGGSIAGVAFSGGEVVVAGTTGNGALSAGTVTTAHSGGSDGFVAKLAGDLTAGAGDRLSYYGGSGEDTVTAMTVKGGQVYLTGGTKGPLPGGSTLVGSQDGFVARLDASTGVVGWSKRLAGKDGQAAPTSIAVAAGGASVLDRLGLPKGELDYTSSQQVVAATSVRPGDQFVVGAREGQRGRTITIEAGDTLKTLATKINRALGFEARAEVVRDGEYERLQIKPRNERTLVKITPGKGGKDALESLGLSEGVVRHSTYNATTKTDDVTETARKIYGLKLDRGLSLSTPAEIKHALAELAGAMVAIRGAYRDLKMAATPKSAQPITGEAPAYLKNQLANYQSALQRLGG